MTTTRLKGNAYNREEYAFKKKHPVKWWFRNKLRKIIRWLSNDDDLYLRDLD